MLGMWLFLQTELCSETKSDAIKRQLPLTPDSVPLSYLIGLHRNCHNDMKWSFGFQFNFKKKACASENPPKSIWWHFSHLEEADSADFKGTVWLQEEPGLRTEGSGWRQGSYNFLSEDDPALSAEFWTVNLIFSDISNKWTGDKQA